jgi:hypothetical protein
MLREEALMGTVHPIHPRLISQYDKTCCQSRDEAAAKYATSTLAQLRQARGELDQRPGTLSITQRAWQAGQHDVLDELIERLVISTTTATR